jgi:aspartate/methionine/tyrosine aminotransferase
LPIVPAQRVSVLRPTAVNAILAEVRQLRAAGKELVSLMRGEPDFPTPAHIVEAAARSLRDGRTAYPDNQGEPALREAVADKIRRHTGLEYSPRDQILVTPGATFGIYAALLAVLDPGDEVLVPDPIYDAYLSPIALCGGVVRRVPAVVEGSRFALRIEALRSACGPRTRAILLNTPWNPVGTVLRRDELEAIAALAAARDLVIISDEIYESIVYEPHAHLSPAAVSPDACSRTIIVNSLSKTYAMTGWRVGYCAGPREWIRAMFLVLQQSSRGPATFVQDASVAALRGPQDAVAAMRDEYARRRHLVCESLATVPGVAVHAPEGGFFAMLDVRNLGRTSDEIRRRLLHDAGVVVVHGAAYGDAAEGTLRLSFASGGEPLASGLSRLRQELSR